MKIWKILGLLPSLQVAFAKLDQASEKRGIARLLEIAQITLPVLVVLAKIFKIDISSALDVLDEAAQEISSLQAQLTEARQEAIVKERQLEHLRDLFGTAPDLLGAAEVDTISAQVLQMQERSRKNTIRIGQITEALTPASPTAGMPLP